MDLFIETANEKTRLSSLGILLTDINASTVSIEQNSQKINNRNVKLFMGANYGGKKITVTGFYTVKTIYEDERMKDCLNGLLAKLEPYHITKMLHSSDLYNYEEPGETSGFSLDKLDNFLINYRYKVLLSDVVDYEFLGKSNNGLLYRVTISFETVDIPFGYTIPTTLDVTEKNKIPYTGTAPCSQLDWPWVVELTATKAQGNYFSLTINDKTLTYTGAKNIALGDVFLFGGMTYTLNSVNITDRTNTTFFELRPTLTKAVPFYLSSSANFKIRILNKVDFYA